MMRTTGETVLKDKAIKTYQIRIDSDLLVAFQKAARAEDRSPASLLRTFMRDYVSQKTARPPWVRGKSFSPPMDESLRSLGGGVPDGEEDEIPF